jgi:hypothetical protein
MTDREGVDRPPLDEKASSRTVHYPKDLDSRPPGVGNLPRSETFDGTRPPSLAGSEDDDDDESDYDWSAEEDLADEEANFGQKISTKKEQKGWGFKRQVLYQVTCFMDSVVYVRCH